MTVKVGRTTPARQRMLQSAPEMHAGPVRRRRDGRNRGVFNGNPPPGIKEAKAYADKFSGRKVVPRASIRLSQANPHILSLAGTRDLVRRRRDRNAVIVRRGRPEDVEQTWRSKAMARC